MRFSWLLPFLPDCGEQPFSWVAYIREILVAMWAA